MFVACFFLTARAYVYSMQWRWICWVDIRTHLHYKHKYATELLFTNLSLSTIHTLKYSIALLNYCARSIQNIFFSPFHSFFFYFGERDRKNTKGNFEHTANHICVRKRLICICMYKQRHSTKVACTHKQVLFYSRALILLCSIHTPAVVLDVCVCDYCSMLNGYSHLLPSISSSSSYTRI